MFMANNCIEKEKEPCHDYVRMIDTYDKLTIPKLLIYYEDLLICPEHEITRLRDWFRVELSMATSVGFIEEFMSKIEKHKRESIAIRKPINAKTMKSKGKLIFHSRRISDGRKCRIDSKVKKMKLAKSGETFSKDHINKLKAARMNRTPSAHKKKPVVCIDDGRIFSSISEAAGHIGVSTSCITLVCQGKNKMIFWIS